MQLYWMKNCHIFEQWSDYSVQPVFHVAEHLIWFVREYQYLQDGYKNPAIKYVLTAQDGQV